MCSERCCGKASPPHAMSSTKPQASRSSTAFTYTPWPSPGHDLQEILRPFLLVCESRNPRLVGLALGSLQKLLSHDSVSLEGRQQVLGALLQVERSNDDTVRLKILQTALTLLQSPSAMDDEVRGAVAGVGAAA